jgi:CheY-like chemotaxis protein
VATIPAVLNTIRSPFPTGLMDRTSPGPLRVLVVDDNADARRSLCALVGLLGYETRAAAGGRAALRLAAQSPPDVVLLDLGEPGNDGHEVARGLRAMPGGAGTLLVAVTGHCDVEAMERGREAGIDAHLLRPVGLPLLEELLRNHALTRR